MKEIYEVIIIDNDNLGNGIARINNLVVFIPNAIKEEIIKIKIIEQKKKYLIGEIIEIKKQSPYRTNPVCKHYNKCGGCKFLHIDYSKELEIKENYIKRLFKDIKVNKIIDTKEYNYRNKVTFHVNNNKIGFYKEKTNELIPIEECHLLQESIIECYNKLKTISLENIKEIIIRTNTKNEIMIKTIGEIENKDILDILKIKGLSSIYQNDKLIYGNPFLEETINDIKYTIYPDAFFQVNTTGMIKLYDKNKEYAKKDKTLLDLYCGTGTIGIYLKDLYDEILGIEINKESIKNAKLNKKINKIENINFLCSDASNINEKYDTVVLDPPRSGLSKQVINKLIEIDPKQIIYTSCNPNSLKKDIELLKDKYQVMEITPFNMFPKTEHVECVCVLNRR